MQRAKAAGFLVGLPLATAFPQSFAAIDERDLLVSVTEKRTEAEIDACAALLGKLGGAA